MQILIIRHGQSEADLLKVHEGRADFPLTEMGRRQAKLMAERVKEHFPPEIIWSSTLKRAKETATILADALDCPVKFEESLMEYNNGILAGLTYEEGKKYPIPKTMHERRVENGESSIEFRMRVESIFSEILYTSTCNRIAIVAHGGVINNLMRAFYKMPVTTEFLFKSGDTAIHLVEITEKERIVHFSNDLSHLKQLQ